MGRIDSRPVLSLASVSWGSEPRQGEHRAGSASGRVSCWAWPPETHPCLRAGGFPLSRGLVCSDLLPRDITHWDIVPVVQRKGKAEPRAAASTAPHPRAAPAQLESKLFLGRASSFPAPRACNKATNLCSWFQ